MSKQIAIYIFSLFLAVLGVTLIEFKNDTGLIVDSILDISGIGLILLGSYLHSNRRVI